MDTTVFYFLKNCDLERSRSSKLIFKKKKKKKKKELSGLYHHIKFERNQSVNG